MGALDILGGVGQGISTYKESETKNSSIERDNAIKDYQIKEAAQKEATLNKQVPLETLFPNSKQYPEGHKFLMDSLEKSGFSVKDPKGIPSMSVRDLLEFKKVYDTKQEISKGFMTSLKTDLLQRHDSIQQKLDTGMDSEGKKINEKDLEALKIEQAKILKRHNSIVNFEEAGKIAIARQKELVKAQNKDIKQYGQMPDGTKLFTQGQNVVTADGKIVSAEALKQATPQTELTRGVPTTSIRVGGEGKDTRTREEKLADKMGISVDKFIEWETSKKAEIKAKYRKLKEGSELKGLLKGRPSR